ncbi:MAG TPA: efflux RND transporter periplasmic adaptor subunit [Thermoanaerobaculia bacterium]|nr:efflux RND transporter periplasmic adaptor subunit [Thermoanaerobaculia bacterium]
MSRIRNLFCVTLIVLAGCGGEKAEAPPPEAQAPAPRAVRTAAVETAGGGTVTVPATVAARHSATLASRLSAAVRELTRREGERVAAGAVVVRLDDGALRGGVTAAEAQVQAAESDLARMQGLAKVGAATPREVEEASARAAGARAMLTGARENLSYAVLRSPFSGVLAARRVEVGDVVSPGQPLVEIEGSGGLELRATLSAEESLGLRPGAPVEARVDGVPETLSARVTALSPAGDPATHRFELRADLPAADGLRSGLFARLVLPAPSRTEESLTVPAAAVFERGGLTGVFVAAEGGKVARLRWIAVGAPAGGSIEVRAGLEAGERVVLDPGDLTDGHPLAPAEEAL